MDQETSQSLIPHSQTRVSTSSLAESSQSLIPHSQEQGLRPKLNPGEGDTVEIHMQRRRDSRLLTSFGAVIHVHPDHPNRVKTDTCSKYFRPVLRIIARRPTSMFSNDTQSQSEHSLSQVY